jgi:hypothetical protein
VAVGALLLSWHPRQEVWLNIGPKPVKSVLAVENRDNPWLKIESSSLFKSGKERSAAVLVVENCPLETLLAEAIWLVSGGPAIPEFSRSFTVFRFSEIFPSAPQPVIKKMEAKVPVKIFPNSSKVRLKVIFISFSRFKPLEVLNGSFKK